jgi:hypothetical protein
MAKTTNDRIAAIELEIEQLGNQRKELLQKQKEADRKSRTSRLCKRGGLLESMLPDTITLSDERFKTLLEITIASNDGKELLAELKAEQDKQTADNAVQTAPPTNPTPAVKPANQSQSVSGASAANAVNQANARV